MSSKRSPTPALRSLELGLALALVAAAAAGDWPGWRGPRHDGTLDPGVLVDEVALGVAWKRPLGAGYPTVSVVDGRAVTAFSDGERDLVAAFDAATGEELWRVPLGATYAGHDGSHDGPISTPLVAGGQVFALAPRGDLAAFDLATGEALWSKALVEELEADKPWYGFSTSPILVDGVLVVEVAAAERFSVAGFDPATGELLWTAGDDKVTYQSPMPFELDGEPQVLSVGEEKLAGLAAATGEVLWQVEHGGDRTPTGTGSLNPVPAGNGRLLLTHKSDEAKMVRLTRRGGRVVADELWTTRHLRGSYVVPVYRDGYLYGQAGRVLTCVDAETGEAVWKSRRPGDGFLTLIDGHLVILTKKGTLHVAEASPEGYREIASLELFDDVTWSPVSFAGERIYARSQGEIAAVRVLPAPPGDEPGAAAAADLAADSRFARFLAAVASTEHQEAVVDSFLAGQESLPLVEGGRVVFLHRSSAADVAIASDVTGDRHEEPMHRVAGTDLFWWSTELEPDTAIKYRFLEDYETWIPDPRNPRRAPSIFGEVSWVAMPEWRQPAHLAEAPRGGRVETFELASEGFEEPRRIDVYLPPGYDDGDERYPVAYVHAGRQARDWGLITNTLDNLIGGSVAPVIAVFIHQLPPAQGGEFFNLKNEYAAIFPDLVRAVDGRYRTIPDRGARASVGAGFGGHGAFWVAFKNPDLVGKVAGQSVMLLSSMLDDLEEIAPSAAEHPFDFYLDWARYEWFSQVENWNLATINEELAELLRARGYSPAGGRHGEGWDWVFWRNHSDKVLEALFPARRPTPAAVTTPGR